MVVLFNGACNFDAGGHCNDSIACTTDTCDPNSGNCTFTVDTTFCADANPCVTWVCDPKANATAVPTGCISTPVVCPAPNDLCSLTQCFAFQGCGIVPVSCSINTTNAQDCSLSWCNATSGQCEVTKQTCATINTVTIVAASLTAAAVVGICVAVVACVGLGGGATYAAYTKFSDEGLADIRNNPLFIDQSKGGANPLHNPDN